MGRVAIIGGLSLAIGTGDPKALGMIFVIAFGLFAVTAIVSAVMEY